MNHIFLSAFVAGLAYAAAPGVINAEAIRRALAHGFGSALRFQAGALAGDALWATIALSGVVAIRPRAGMQLILGGCGALLLIWMAWGTLHDSLHEHTPSALQPSRHSNLQLGALLSLANPFAVVFWLSMGAGLLPVGALTSQLPAVATMIGAFLLATLIWSVLLAGIASYGRMLIGASAFRWLNAGSGIGMALFGVDLFWHTLVAL
jgi:threonine/homoserine/homoserine lactone efflux protein